MREKMFKYFSANSTKKIYRRVRPLVDQYNNKIHLSIRMTPTEASSKKNEAKVWRNLYHADMREDIAPKFSIGVKVRITKKKGTFEKGYTPR